MEGFVSLVGIVFAAFFLLSLAVETILENLRGALSLFGITWLKSQKSLQQALDEVAEFVPADHKDYARFEALVSFVEGRSQGAAETLARLKAIREDLAKAIDPAGKLGIIDREKEWITEKYAPFRVAMEQSEEKRVFMLRIISAVIGVGIAWASGLNVLDLVAATPGEREAWYHGLGYLIGGLAAAGGSSFWHDQLDRVRSVKQIGQQLVSLVPAKPGG